MVLHQSRPASDPESDMAGFMLALEQRRQQVYDYLDKWPGAADFKPGDIHDAIYSYVRRRGKALRPLVLMLSCGAVGGDEQQALPAAAAVEVFHTWTLVHDDIIDRDSLRRGSPTIHAEFARRGSEVFGLSSDDAAHYGNAVAILAGDLQQSWAFALLGDLVNRGAGAQLVLDLIERMATSLTPRLLEGEMLDVQYALTPPEDLTEEQVLLMLNRKTGALLEYAAWCGAKIGLGGKADPGNVASKLGKFASMCGTAFQLRDDLLGLTADEATLGKSVGSDIREGKRTLIVHRALATTSGEQRNRILSALGKPQASNDEVERAIQAIVDSGAAHQVNELANELITEAETLLSALPDTPQRKHLASWASFLLSRQY